MKSLFFTLFLLFIQYTSFSQENNNVVIEDKTLEGQFDKIYRISTSYQTYKVISKDKFQELKNNVLDSIKASNKDLKEQKVFLKNERDNVAKLNAELNKTKEDLKKAQEKENSISLFGFQISKVTYNLILWLIIISLALALVFFVFKFSKSNILTKKAKEDLEDVEQEFEVQRKKSLEREQKLRRQLQDEINKQRNS
jgi:septal ring factor EnvC (AmiA/AmiB activator)